MFRGLITIVLYSNWNIVEPFLQWNDDGIEMAKSRGVPILLTEYNTASCGGDPTVAPTVSFLRSQVVLLTLKIVQSSLPLLFGLLMLR